MLHQHGFPHSPISLGLRPPDLVFIQHETQRGLLLHDMVDPRAIALRASG